MLEIGQLPPHRRVAPAVRSSVLCRAPHKAEERTSTVVTWDVGNESVIEGNLIEHGLSGRVQFAAWADLEGQLKVFTTATGWEGPNELLLCAAAAPTGT